MVFTKHKRNQNNKAILSKCLRMVLVSSLFNHYEIFIKEDYKRKSSQYISMKDEEDDFDEQPTRQVSILCYFKKF